MLVISMFLKVASSERPRRERGEEIYTDVRVGKMNKFTLQDESRAHTIGFVPLSTDAYL